MTAKLCFMGILLAISALLLRNFGYKGASVFASLAFIVLLSDLPGVFSEIIKTVMIYEELGESAAAIFKVVGTGYLFGVSSEICSELNERGIATALALAGRFEIIAIALPFISEIFRLALSLVN